MLHELAFIELLSVRRVACIYIDLSYTRQLLCYLSVYATFIFIHDFTCNRVLSVPVGDEQININININKFGVSLETSQLFTSTQVRGGENLHVRTCTPVFHISQTAGRIAFKFCVTH